MRRSCSAFFVAFSYVSLFSVSNPALGLTLTPLTNLPSPSQGWQAVACSADGTKLVACAYAGGIYTSTDSGVTWVSNSAPVKNWSAVASSADGTRLAAAAFSNNGQIWTNSGTTWYQTTAPAAISTTYDSIASSADGTRLFAAVLMGPPPTHFIYGSADSGTTWYQTSAPNLSWYAVACSSDGTKLVATAYNANAIYTSTDSGINWTPHTVPLNNWFAVCSSADGSKLVSVQQSGGLFTSADSGVTWISNSLPSEIWYSVASSSDGSNIVATGINSFFNSTNFGRTWISNSSPPILRSVACSTNGTTGIISGATGPTTPFLYRFTTTVASPVLSLISSNTQLAVAWPSSVSGFQLQQNTNLSIGNWSNVTAPVLLSNGMNEVILSPTNPAAFYRLHSQ